MTARIRVFKEGVIDMYPGEYCYGSERGVVIHASSGGSSIFSWNKKIGMPVTEDMPRAYNEYVIQAGLPFSIRLQKEVEKDGTDASCGTTGVTFFPLMGRNYDVTTGNPGSCFVMIRELIETSPGKAAAMLLPVSPSFPCGVR